MSKVSSAPFYTQKKMSEEERKIRRKRERDARRDLYASNRRRKAKW